MGYHINKGDGEELVNELINKAFDQCLECKHPALFAAAVVDEMLKRKSFHDMTDCMEKGMAMEDALHDADVPLLKEISQIVLALADVASFGGDYTSEHETSEKAVLIRAKYAKRLVKGLEEAFKKGGSNDQSKSSR